MDRRERENDSMSKKNEWKHFYCSIMVYSDMHCLDWASDLQVDNVDLIYKLPREKLDFVLFQHIVITSYSVPGITNAVKQNCPFWNFHFASEKFRDLYD